jgi:uncharacterized protein YoxC
MFELTVEQKLANVNEEIQNCEKKLEGIQQHLEGLRAKREKLLKSQGLQGTPKTSNFDTALGYLTGIRQ